MSRVGQIQYVTRADERSVDLRGAVSPHCAGIIGGLVAVQAGAPRILTGIVAGPVRIAVDRRTAPPAVVADGWEDVAEISCAPDEDADAVVAAGPYAAAPGPQSALRLPDEGWFRLRIHARYRDARYDLIATEPHEEYLLVTWPAQPEAPAVLAASSHMARDFEGRAEQPTKPSSDPTLDQRAQELFRLRAERHRRRL